MLGAIAGDVIGSVYEGAGLESTDFPLFRPGSRFTDDSVLTAAVAQAFYGGVPGDIGSEARRRLAPDLRDVLDRFEARFMG